MRVALSQVSVVVLEPVAVFEFGVAVEVFGIDRREEGVPNFDFRVCSLEPGRPLATKNLAGFTITPPTAVWTPFRAAIWSSSPRRAA